MHSLEIKMLLRLIVFQLNGEEKKPNFYSLDLEGFGEG